MDNSNILDDVFDNFIRNTRIFRDREVLRHDYLPNRLPHRGAQIKRLGETVAPVLKGVRCSNVFLYGKPGTGKTAVTKYVLNHLEKKATELDSSVGICYVNCRLTGGVYRVFLKMCQSLGIPLPFTGLSIGEAFERYRKGLDSSRITFIVVLDEIDALIKTCGDDILYELSRINETMRWSKVSIVGISNDLRIKEFLDARVLSSLSEEEVVFKPYDADELNSILLGRAHHAFCEGALSNSALRLCAALAAAEHGDARRALDLLRVAGEVAERKGASVVVEDDLREAERRIEHDRIVEALRSLTLHSKLVILSLFHLEKAKSYRSITGEIYKVYCDLCIEACIAPLTQRRASMLISELDSIGLVNAQVISRGRYGRTKKIRLGVARNLIRKVFSGDNRLGCLVECRLQDH